MIRFKTNLEDLIHQYETEYLIPRGRELTVNRHRLSTIVKTMGRDPVITPIDIERFLKQFKISNRNRYAAVLKAVLRWGMEIGDVEGEIPKKILRMEKERGARTRRMTKDEEERLLAAMGGDLRDLFIAAVDTGLRHGALRRLLSSDTDGETLVVPASIQKQGQMQRIPLTKRLGEIVARRTRQIAEAGGGPQPLFTVPNFRVEWDAARQQAGVSNLHWHDLRGEFASRLSEAGVGVETVSRLLGHASITMTQRYLRPRLSQFDDAIRKLGV